MTKTGHRHIVDYLLRTGKEIPETLSAFGEWKEKWAVLAPKWKLPADRALAGGLAADRPAWAFAAGYQAAIHCLTDPADLRATAAVCISEKEGGHPARIKTCLTEIPGSPKQWKLEGSKHFVSGGGDADILWVAAVTGKYPDGRNILRMAGIPASAPGLTFTLMPSLHIVPEMPHARIDFSSVFLSGDDLSAGDAYREFVKPFRTVEDLHVTAAFLAWLLAVALRSAWPSDIPESLLALIVTARSLALEPPLEPYIHIALGGLLRQVRHLLKETEPLWENTDTLTRERWQRDRKILEIAETARGKRLETAWRYYDSALGIFR